MSSIGEVESFFDKAAPRYDGILTGNGWPANAMLRDTLAGEMPVDNALDLGAGTGLSTEVILDVAQPRLLVAVDISTGMLEHLKRRCNNDTRIVISRMAISQFLTETHSRFDLVVAIGLLHFLPEPRTAISGVARVLNDRGHFVFTYDPFLPGHPTNGEDQTMYDVTVYRNPSEQIEDNLRQNDLKVIENRFFIPKPNSDTDYQGAFVVAKKINPFH